MRKEDKPLQGGTSLTLHSDRPEPIANEQDQSVFLELRLLDFARDGVIEAIRHSDTLEEAADRVRRGRFSVARSAAMGEAGAFALYFLDQTDDD